MNEKKAEPIMGWVRNLDPGHDPQALPAGPPKAHAWPCDAEGNKVPLLCRNDELLPWAGW